MDDLYDAKQEIESLKLELESTKLELAKYRACDDAYRWKHIGLFEWDFTTGIVEEEVYVETPEGRMGMAEAAGVTLPCRIDDLTSAFADACVDPAYAHWYRTNLSTEFVREMHEEKGSFELAFERKLKPEVKGYSYARYSAPVIKDPQTGHLIARGVIADVTNRYNLIAPLEFKEMDVARAALVAAMKEVFLLVYYVNVKDDTFEEFAAVGSVHGMVSMQQGTLSARKTMSMMASFYDGEMRRSYEEFADLDTLPRRMGELPMLSTELCTTNGRWALTSFVVVSRDEAGSISDIIVTAQDVTSNHERELALQEARDAANAANEAKSNFLFNMSHDIRTPMNAIIGFTDLIERHYDDREKCMDYLHKTQEANGFLLSLINNVLEMARIESGKEQLNETLCRGGAVTHEIISIFEDQIRQKNITFSAEVDIHTPYMLGDQSKLREICLNILSNAVKYTPEGGSISVKMLELPCERPGYARICGVCADSGIGMSKDFLPHLFEEFTRARSATESRQQGTGLGMPIVKKIVDLMGGTIEVESELGQGTTFTVTLDLRIADAIQEEAPEVGGEAVQVDFEGKRVLLAEDNELNAEIAIEILSEAGFEVDRAEDGAVAVRMLEQTHAGTYDVVLMDIQMPNMNGYEATRAIRALDDEAKAQIPILAMTANAFEEDKREALRNGMNGHIAKPIDILELMKSLMGVLG